MYQHIVQYYETDKMGITHHSNYIRWMEEARVDFLEKTGWSYAKLEEEGIVSPVTAVECKYRQSTTFPDTIDIEVLVEEFKGVRLKLKYVNRALRCGCIRNIRFFTALLWNGRRRVVDSKKGYR